MLRCPNCSGIDIGKIGSQQYYCWNCFLELTITDDQQLTIYQIEADGSRYPLNDLFTDAERKIQW